MKLYVGNLSRKTNDAELAKMFAPFGKATSAQVATDRATGTSRGFGFVEFPNDDEARAAISGLDGKEVDGQVLKVNESRPKAAR